MKMFRKESSIGWKSYLGLFLGFVLHFICHSQSHVLELDDRFREARKTGEWLVMFYAPWCGHCKQLEPTWMEVGDAMRDMMPVHVARLDCTRYSSLSGEFGVRGFPTIKYITGENEYEYRGARTKNDIIAFARKARGPKLSDLTSTSAIEVARKKHNVFYLYLGEADTNLRSSYDAVANKLFLTLNLYAALPESWPSVTNAPTVLVFKDGTYHEMPLSLDANTAQMSRWMMSEQMSDYSELTGVSYHNLKGTMKSFVIAVLPEKDTDDLYATAKNTALARNPLFLPKFVFCWVTGTGIINRMTYGTISTPNIVVYNPQNYEYFVLRSIESSTPITSADIHSFLTDIIEEKLSPLGGSGFFQQIRRFFSDSTSMVVNFFKDSPIIASLVIGVPTFVITFLCYCLCTMEEVEEEAGTDSEDEYDDDRPEEGKLPEYEAEDHESAIRQRNIESLKEKSGEEQEAGDPGAETETDKTK